jgi:hypothetical protein
LKTRYIYIYIYIYICKIRYASFFGVPKYVVIPNKVLDTSNVPNFIMLCFHIFVTVIECSVYDHLVLTPYGLVSG